MMCLPLVLILLTCKTDAAPADSGGKLTFLEASNKCTGIGKQLPKAESAPEYEKLIVRMKEKALDTLWLRVQKNSFGPNTHKWLNGITFKETLSGPDYKGPPKECGIMETVYSKKDDAICYEKHGYICRLESCSSCDFLSPYECVRLGDICYRIYDFVSGWFTARNICEKEKGQLAVIPSEEDRKRLSALVHKHHQDQDKFFIGFRRIEFNYYEVNGGEKEVRLYHWYVGEPSDKGDCVVMKSFPEGYFWASASCSETHSYVCLENKEKLCQKQTALPYWKQIVATFLLIFISAGISCILIVNCTRLPCIKKRYCFKEQAKAKKQKDTPGNGEKEEKSGNKPEEISLIEHKDTADEEAQNPTSHSSAVIGCLPSRITSICDEVIRVLQGKIKELSRCVSDMAKIQNGQSHGGQSADKDAASDEAQNPTTHSSAVSGHQSQTTLKKFTVQQHTSHSDEKLFSKTEILKKIMTAFDIDNTAIETLWSTVSSRAKSE